MKKLLICLLLFGCGPNSLQDFEREGETKCRKLVTLLEKIETKEDLFKAETVLNKKFNELVDLMIAARRFQEKYGEMTLAFSNKYSEKLKKEIQRLYSLDGGREIIERAQREPIIRLDAKGP